MACQNRLFIGGEFVDARRRRHLEVLNPHDGSVLAEVAEARAGDVDRAVDAAARGVPGLASHCRPPSAGGCCCGSPTPSRRTPKSWPSWRRATPGTRSATRPGWTCRARRPASATSAAWPTRSQGDVVPVERRLPQLRHPRAARRRRPDRAVELPADVHQLEDGSGAGRRQHRRAEAGRAHAADLAAAGRADGRGRVPARRGQHGARLRPHRRASALADAPRRGQDRLHRLHGDRAAASSRPRPATSSGSSSSSAARAPTSSSPTPTSPPRSTARPSRSSTTRARPASPAAGCCCTRPIADEFLDRFLDAGPIDPDRRPARPGDRDGPAHLADAPRPCAVVRQDRRRRGRRGAHGRHGARRPGAGQGLLRRAHGRRGPARTTGSAAKRSSARSSP